jgi:pimeloyl-ACP methyl ester carboxylesterase
VSFESSFVEILGSKVHLRRGGKGRPLLFLHGASGAPVILPFMEKLAERFDVLVPEHPGYGRSEEPAWLENIHDMAYFYLDFLKHFGLKDVTLVGNSMGGWIAMELAVRDTSRLSSVVLVGPAGLAAPGVQPADIFLMAPEVLIKNLFFDEKMAAARLAQPVTPEMVDIALKNSHTTARMAWEPRLHDPFLPKWLHRIDVPVKVIWGREDRILPSAFVPHYQKVLPKAEFEVFERCGHLPHAEYPEKFCDSVFRFACK